MPGKEDRRIEQENEELKKRLKTVQEEMRSKMKKIKEDCVKTVKEYSDLYSSLINWLNEKHPDVLSEYRKRLSQ